MKKILNITLRYLTGNPCTEFEGYRDYVISTLPQLKVNFSNNFGFIRIFFLRTLMVLR